MLLGGPRCKSSVCLGLQSRLLAVLQNNVQHGGLPELEENERLSSTAV